MEGQKNRSTGLNCNDQDNYIAMTQALARLLERLDKEEGLSDEQDIYMYPNQVQINNASDQELIGSARNPQSPELEHQSRFRPIIDDGHVVSDETQEKEGRLVATQPTKNDNEQTRQPSTELRKSINQSAQPWSTEVQQVGVWSSVELSTTNNCSSNTGSVKGPNDLLESAFVYKTQPFENIVNSPTNLENINSSMSIGHNPTSVKLTENSISLEYERFGDDETVVTYNTDNTLIPSMLNRAKNGVYSKDSRRYVTLAHSNNQLDGGVCSVGVDLTADQLQGLYQTDKVYPKCEQLDKNMLGRQIDHLAKYTSYSKPNNYKSTNMELIQGNNSPDVMSCSDESLLSWKECLSTLESDENDDGCNLFPTVTEIDDQDSTQWIQNKNKHSKRNNSLARPYLDISRQWSWYPYKEKETPGKTTSPRRKKILTPCSKHFCKNDNSTEVNDPFQYGDCEQCNDYVYNFKLLTMTSTPSDLSSKAFLRKLMESTNNQFQDDVSPYSFSVNRVVADTSNLTDSILYEKKKFSTTVDMSGDDITNINKVNDRRQQKSLHCNQKSIVREMSQWYQDIANAVVWDVLLNSVAKIAVSVIINRAVESMLTSQNMLENKIPITKIFNDSDYNTDMKKQNEDELQSFTCIGDSIGSHTLDMESSHKIFEQKSVTESYSTHEINTCSLPIKQITGIVPITDTDISEQSLPSTNTLDDNSGLSLSDMTFESFKFMKGRLSAVRHTARNIGLADDSLSSVVYANDSNLNKCEPSFKILERAVPNETDKMSNFNQSCSPLAQHLVRTEQGKTTQGCKYDDKITTTCKCCNRYICKLDEKLHRDENIKIKLVRDENIGTGTQVVEGEVTPPYNSQIVSINMPTSVGKTKSNQSSCPSDAENLSFVSTESSFFACNEEESNSILEDLRGEVEPAGIDTKIYACEKFPNFRSPPKQVAVIENPETPTKERIQYFERLAACYNDDPNFENPNQKVLNKSTYDDDFMEIKIEKQQLSKTNINSPSELGRREKIDEVPEKRTESPGSFTIFQAFFDALYSSPSEESEFIEPNRPTAEELSASCGQKVEIVGHMKDQKLNDVNVDLEASLYEDHEITRARSSDGKDKVDVLKTSEITQQITSDDQIARSSTSPSISNEICITDKAEKKRTRCGFFKRLFTKKNQPNKNKKNINNENERVGPEFLYDNNSMHSDIEWKEEVEAVENILVTDGKKTSHDQETHFVDYGKNIKKQKHTKRKSSFSDVELPADLSETAGGVSKCYRHVSQTSTSKNDNTKTTNVSSNKRLFSFKDVKRSQNKDRTKSSRHRRT